jgi:hypothetical protein
MQQENMLRPKFINYATAIMTEINPAINYGRSTFGMICRLSKFHKNKPFRDTTREDAENRDRRRPIAPVDWNI